MNVLRDIVKECVGCNICANECSFLDKHGSPGSICERFLSAENHHESAVFQCNLCGLCESVCPKNLPCSLGFLEIRKSIQKSNRASTGKSVYKQHKALCAYEARGTSPAFSLHLFPDGCESVFFPGCTLTATRSGVTQKTYESLKSFDSTVGIVLDCCTKPSHDLGLTEKFEHAFTELCDLLKANKIKRILTACPSCYTTFKKHAPHIETYSVYEILAANMPPEGTIPLEKFSIHDTCATRNVSPIHDSVRALVKNCGAEISEMEHSRSTAICCGEGAAAAFLAPDITDSWKTIRKREAAGKRIITYCAGCSSTLGKDLPATHLLDLLFDRERALEGKERIAKAPFTYINRLLLKNRLLREDKTARRCRRASDAPQARAVFLSRILPFLLLYFKKYG